jgi:hypothetical protein
MAATPDHTEIREALQALIHPGMSATINGHRIKRQALRFYSVDDGRYAYSLDDAVAMVSA